MNRTLYKQNSYGVAQSLGEINLVEYFLTFKTTFCKGKICSLTQKSSTNIFKLRGNIKLVNKCYLGFHFKLDFEIK